MATPDGETPIENIKAGQEVYAFDFDTGKVETKNVTCLHPHFTFYWVDIQIGDRVITSTRAYRFWIENEHRWIPALELKSGMLVQLENGQTEEVKVVNLRDLDEPEATYNFEVEQDHDYFVGTAMVLVHNGSSDSTPGPNPALEGDPYHPASVRRRIKPPFEAAAHADPGIGRPTNPTRALFQ